ncbi:cation:proton antiporter [Aureimonas sp. N4]|uniref:cation:proton antiporter n=1 Tax=Aureimonas sp. N4 TaxID=1638165 RepID=UPI0007867B0B|nr:cation:proton antiporter [Aureimonas sp. N4]
MSFAQFSERFLDIALTLSLVFLCISFLCTVIRIWKGPTLPDRVLGLDVLTSSSIGFIAVIGIDTGFTLYVDIAIALGLVGFLATISFARFIMARGDTERSPVASVTEPEADSKILGEGDSVS